MDETPATLFESYELDLRHTLDDINDKLDPSASASGGAEQRKATLRKVEIALDDADDIISALELELRGIPQSLRAPYTARLKASQGALALARKRAREAQVQQVQTQGLRAGVAASDDPYGEHVEQGDRARLLSGMQTLEGSGRRLRDTQRVALEAEDQGADILRALRGQRETIESARDTVRW
ncbi:hypothetical protein C0992_007319 [Termitomyces sp. T32_za158]|nr:hypothetical protein C0992_007319 [Termitomyces sp. T32_za158]